ncbi:hypothetical protein [Candidatus Leptofilum sp.]|uniref:hypothetical protein n=1 Tax=Candidatus Leptofilum sp. TaxID=3241576 RepID=UPI003B5B9F5E
MSRRIHPHTIHTDGESTATAVSPTSQNELPRCKQTEHQNRKRFYSPQVAGYSIPLG